MVLITVATDKTQYTPGQDINVTGTLRNDNGTPIGQVTVRVRFLRGTTELYNYGFYVDPSGHFGFVFSGFNDPGSYTCEASYPTTNPTATATAQFTVTGTVVITLALDKTTVEPGESFTASGLVTLNGTPYGGADVGVGIAASGGGGDFYFLSARTDGTGHYSILMRPSINVGQYSVHAVSGPSTAGPITLTVAFATTITLVLDKTSMGQTDMLGASGHVLRNGAPLSGVLVVITIYRENIPVYDNSTYTDTNGQYLIVFQPNLAVGQYTVVAAKANGPASAAVGLTVTGTPPPVTTLTLSVSATTIVAGSTFTASGRLTTNGQPVASASVTVSVEGGSTPATVTTNASGDYSVERVAPSAQGSYEVQAMSGTTAALPVLITVTPGGGGNGGGGGFDWTPFIPLILLGVGGVVVLAAAPIIIGITRKAIHEGFAQAPRKL